jgi:hypothetical protein
LQSPDVSSLVKSGDYSLSIVSDQNIQSARWIKADFTSAGQSFTIPASVINSSDWQAFADDPTGYALRFITLGAANSYDLILTDNNGTQIRFPVSGAGGILGGVSTFNQTAIADFAWLIGKAPAGFDWKNVASFSLVATQPGWQLMTDIQIIRLNSSYQVAMGIAGHDLQGAGWRERLDNYTRYFGQKPTVGTFFTTIFEPIRESQDSNDHNSDIIERATALTGMGTVPAITLEFRSWAQKTQDQAQICAERALFNSINAGGISYDDFITNYLNQNKVLDAVNAGLLDPYLKALASDLAAFNSPVYVRLFHEPYWWFPWGMREQADIQKFKDAWMRVGQIFETAGADNVNFVMTLDPAQPGEGSWSEVTAIPSKYLAVVELDGYTDPYLRQNADLSANELFTQKLTEIAWQLQIVYPDAAMRPSIALGEFAFTGGQQSSKQQVYDYFISDLIHRAYPIDRFSLLYTYQAGPRPADDSLNYSPAQEDYWSASWQPEDPWYSSLLNDLDNRLGIWKK